MKITLKAMRVNKGLSQTDVANALGVTVKTLQNWEANEHLGYTPPNPPRSYQHREADGYD